MDNNLAQVAIQQALAGNWKEAIKVNKSILKDDKTDVDALNRIARAYAEEGDLSKAKTHAKKVLKIDKNNSIAQKALSKWNLIKKNDTYKSGPTQAQVFLEEPGKTKIVNLINIGDVKLLSSLDAGDCLKMKSHGHKISICSNDNKYVGRLPDDLSSRLKTLLKHGYEYKVYIKTSNKDEVKVFIREAVRGQKTKDIPSFTSDKIEYISFTPPELVHKKSDSPSISKDLDESE